MEMDKIKELQDLWQNQISTNKSDPDSARFMNSVLAKVKKTERKVFRKNLAKTIAIMVILISFTVYFYLLQISSLYSWLGISVILGSTIIMMILYWNIQFKSSQLKHNLPQKEFIEDAIFQMMQQKVLFNRIFKWFVLLMIIGINILYLDLLKDTEWVQRIILHFGISLLLMVIFLLGQKIRKRKFRKEFQPLINELKAIKDYNE